VSTAQPATPLRLRERLFLRWCCVPPPPIPFEPREHGYSLGFEPNPLDRLGRVFGEEFTRAVSSRVVVDIGCGPGDQVRGVLQAGASKAIGVALQPIYLDIARRHAQEAGVGDRAHFVASTTAVPAQAADVVFSQNSFEHFRDPTTILDEAARILRPGGVCFITFGPPWWHPHGVHMHFMIRRPWVHAFFSERTILRVRQLYRPNAPMNYQDCGLNQMTIRKFRRLIARSPLSLRELRLTPIHHVPAWLNGLLPEVTTAHVSAVLTATESAPR